MGYDWNRFIDGNDEELQCQICLSVPEKPVETPCQHHFCDVCIREWTSVDPVCPVDRHPLTAADLRQPSRLLLNLIGRLQIKCDFQNNGCPQIIRLDNLQNHRSKCMYDPEREVTCDKGCKLKMTKRAYQEDSCLEHLKKGLAHSEKKVNESEALIQQLLEELNVERDNKREAETAAENVIKDLKEENAKAENVIKDLREDNSKLKDKITRGKQLAENVYHAYHQFKFKNLIHKIQK